MTSKTKTKAKTKAPKTVADKVLTYLKARKSPATLPQIMSSEYLKGVSENSVRPLLGLHGKLGDVVYVKTVKCPITKKYRYGYYLPTTNS